MQYSCPRCRKIYPDNEGIIQFGSDTSQKEQFFPENAFDTLYQSEEKNFWFRVRNKIIGDAVTRYLPHHSRILEVGCGTGYVSWYLKKIGYHVECADLFLGALQFCKARDAGDLYYQYDLSDRLFINEFDSICAFDVLEHIDDDNTILKNLHDALKPAGTLLITVPADMRLWSAMDIYAEHKRRYSRPELRQKIEGNGFKVIKMSYFMTLLYPFILISRKLSFQQEEMKRDNAKNQIKRKAMNELNPNPILNFLFFLVFSMEVPFLRSVALPFGSSLLCVAVKEQ